MATIDAQPVAPETPAVPEVPAEQDKTAPLGVDLTGPKQDPNKAAQYGNEDEEFLFGKTNRPNETMQTGVMARKAPASEMIYRYLPELLAAAAEPDAPAELHAFLRLLQHHLGA
jgi:hypothetical protein